MLDTEHGEIPDDLSGTSRAFDDQPGLGQITLRRPVELGAKERTGCRFTCSEKPLGTNIGADNANVVKVARTVKVPTQVAESTGEGKILKPVTASNLEMLRTGDIP